MDDTKTPSYGERIVANRSDKMHIDLALVYEQVVAGGPHSNLASLLWTAVREVDSTVEDMRRTAASIHSDLDRMVRNLDGGFSINSLGVIQSTGPDLDRLAALLTERTKTLVGLLWMWELVHA